MTKSKIILSFLAISAITTYVYLFDVEPLKNIDTINHFLGGVLLVALIPRKIRRDKPLYAFAAATFIFFGWELLEIYFASNGIYPRLFEETVSNKIQDIIFDFLGFIMFYKR